MQFPIPTTPMEIIGNIKTILNMDLLITPEFATEENVKAIFGGSLTRIFDNRDNAKIVCVHKFPKSLKLGDACIHFSIVDENGKIAEQGKIRGSAKGVGFFDPNFTIDAIESLLGPPTQIDDRFSPEGHPMPVKRKTHRLGLKRITYNFDSSRTKKTIVFETDGDGTITGFYAGEEQK